MSWVIRNRLKARAGCLQQQLESNDLLVSRAIVYIETLEAEPGKPCVQIVWQHVRKQLAVQHFTAGLLL